MFTAPYGGRRQLGVVPVRARMRASVEVTWESKEDLERVRRSGWDQLWFCTLWPWSCTRRVTSGYAATFWPISKKVARAPYWASSART